MVKIRLRRTGAKKKPTYRVVVADSRAPRDGKFIEIIGHYNPRTEPRTVKLHEDRVLHWLSVGAQPTDIVHKLLENQGTLERLARLKQGADLEELLAEAANQAETTSEEPKTKAKKAEKKPKETEPEAQAEDAEAEDSEDNTSAEEATE